MAEKCPHCGYCPHCGRANTAPTYPNPYPYYPYPYRPYWTSGTIGGSVTAAAPSTVTFKEGFNAP